MTLPEPRLSLELTPPVTAPAPRPLMALIVHPTLSYVASLPRLLDVIVMPFVSRLSRQQRKSVAAQTSDVLPLQMEMSTQTPPVDSPPAVDAHTQTPPSPLTQKVSIPAPSLPKTEDVATDTYQSPHMLVSDALTIIDTAISKFGPLGTSPRTPFPRQHDSEPEITTYRTWTMLEIPGPVTSQPLSTSNMPRPPPQTQLLHA